MHSLGILLSGRGSNFVAIADSIDAGRIADARIAVVISNKADAPGIATARQRGLECSGDSIEGQAAGRARPRSRCRAQAAQCRSGLPCGIHAVALAVVCAAVSAQDSQYSSLAAARVSRTRSAGAGFRLRSESLRLHGAFCGRRTRSRGDHRAERPFRCSTLTTSTTLAARILEQEHIAYTEAINIVLGGKFEIVKGRPAWLRLTSQETERAEGCPTWNESCRAVSREFLRHLHDRQRFSVAEWDFLILDRCISLCLIKSHAAQGCAHLEAREARFPGGLLAGFEDHAADAAPRPLRMHEERSNLGRIARQGRAASLRAPRY